MDPNPPFETAVRRAPEQTQISISLAKELLARIDTAAKAENRNRSNFITTHLERALAGFAIEDKPRKKKKKKDREDY
jgi:metal-responsive CopG/Arc/MetJ family transcriptional regulator